MTDFVWTPSPELIATSRQTEFLKFLGLSDEAALHRLGAENPAAFWDGVVRFAGLRFYTPYTSIMDDSAGPAWTRWCVGGKTNLVLNCIDRHRDTAVYDKTFLIWSGEDGSERRYTYREFDAETCRIASGLKRMGIDPGDVVALYMPQVPETLVAYYAIIKIGGVVMPLFSGFGASAVRERLELSHAKAIVTADGTLRRGRSLLMKPVVDEAVAGLPTRVIVASRLGAKAEIAWDSSRDHRWQDLFDSGDPECPTEVMHADAPAILHYTSGTTGKPKGCIYTQVGIAAKMVLDHGILNDFRESDRHFCMADMGWMVGSKMAVLPAVHGASLIIAEGTPDYPETDRFWRLMAKHRATFAELSPALVRLMMQYGDDQVQRHDLSAMRVFITGGEPWTERPWNWLYHVVGRSKVPVINSAGGTEVSGSILICDLHHPMKVGSFSIAIPGMGADVVDEGGRPVPSGVFGELVMRQSSIGLTRGLWNEPERYQETYWERIPNLWVHGDFASRDEDGHWYLHGRSDDTLKVSGKRVGPAEIENAVMKTGQVRECAVVGVPNEKTGTAIVLVCVAADLDGTDVTLAGELREAVERDLGRSFRPERVLFVSDLPKTRNLKIMRRVIRAAIAGDPVGDISSLTNPGAVNEVAAVAAQQGA